MSDAFNAIVWRHGANEVRFDVEALPIMIGTVSAADIRISGPGGQSIAQIDLVDGKPFVQPLLRPSPMTLDGEVLSATRSLASGQQLSAFDVTLDVQHDATTLVLTQQAAASAFETVPPVIAESDDDGESVSATAWQPTVDVVQTRSKRPLVIGAIVAALALFAAVIGWITTAIPVRLETSPAQPAVVRIDGPSSPIQLADRYLFRKGVYTITLQSPGYADLTQRVEIDGSKSALVFEQRPLPGALIVTLADAGADARVALTATDGSRHEATLPAQIDGLLPGSYTLEAAAAGFVDFAGTVDVVGLGKTQQLSFALVPDAAQVDVVSEPAGATVTALSDNQVLADATPATITLAAGRQRVLYQLDGYKPVERAYEVFANTRDAASPVVLEPADASLRVTSRPSGASVTLNGSYSGRTPLTLALEPGRNYDVRLSSPGHAAASRRVALRSGQQRNLDIRLDARLGDVTIRTVPVDAEIFVNGESRGRGTLTVSLPAEPQRITVRKPGFVDWEKTVTPRPGFTQTVDATLKTPQQVAEASIKQAVSGANDHAFRYVRPGTFKQGSSRREANRRANEVLHDVRITRAYYLGVHEVTNAQFSAFRENHTRGGDVYPSIAGDNNPVVNVSWQDAAAYCNWLSEKDGLQPAYTGEYGSLLPNPVRTDGYRLPTEAEWVWAARYEGASGTAKRYGWGPDMPPKKESVNIADVTAEDLLTNILRGYRDGFPATAPVGSFSPNALGVHDLDGNVSEWLHDYYTGRPVTSGPQIDPRGPAAGEDHVIRGPSWRDANAGRLRLAYRDFGKDGDIQTGFRIVKPTP